MLQRNRPAAGDTKHPGGETVDTIYPFYFDPQGHSLPLIVFQSLLWPLGAQSFPSSAVLQALSFTLHLQRFCTCCLGLHKQLLQLKL